MPQRLTPDIFQEELLFILAASRNLVLKVVPIEAGQFSKNVLVFPIKNWSFFMLPWIFKILKLKEKSSSNHGKKICRLFQILAKCPFTQGKREPQPRT